MSTVYAKVEHLTLGAVTAYPITIFELRSLYPNVSWPNEPSPQDLAAYNIVIVQPTPKPTTKKRQNLVSEGTPVYNNSLGIWQQTWVVLS